MKDLLHFISEGGSVVRYHTRPGIKPDTNAHHSHGVVMLCSLLAGTDSEGFTTASVYLLMAAATHDLAEQVPGDVSAPAKRLLDMSAMLHKIEQSVLKKYNLDYESVLTDNERLVLKFADSFDGMLYCCRELALGNRNVLLIWRRWCSYVENITSTGDVPIELALRASNIYEALKEIYRETISVTGPDFDCFKEG